MPAPMPPRRPGDEPTYSRSVFEAILAGMGCDDPSESECVCCEDGARVKQVDTDGLLADLHARTNDGDQRGGGRHAPSDVAHYSDAQRRQRRLPSQPASWLGDGGDIPICGSTGIVGFHDKAKVSGPGVVTGRSGALGDVHFVWQDCWPPNTALWVKEFKRVTPLFALYLLRGMNLGQFNGGVSVPTLDRKVVHKAELALPPVPSMERFDAMEQDVHQQIGTLTKMNAKLRAARDLRLPRLMSGELAV